ncbi:MAG: flagellar basal body-associated FliL family protein [Hyphomicrobiaceae bacterium]|nr:flagellar basal body-associated FliL family protein [Hyphomicrobiaceae bacterium]
MAEEKTDLEAGGEDAGGEPKKKPMMLIIAVVLVLVGGGAGGAFFMGMFDSAAPQGEAAELVETPSVYFDIPEMVVNLASGRGRAQYLKLKIAIEAESQEHIEALKPKMPRIQDMFQIYLREMRRSDLEGSAGVYRLKHELMRRINITIHPAKIKRVLFKEIIIQ